MKTVSQILTEAAGRVDRGWAQGGLVAGCVCAVEAIAESVRDGNELVHMKTFNMALNALRDQVTGTIVNWNDMPGRTKEEVVAALLRAAKVSEA
jgi:hypothetical protein